MKLVVRRVLRLSAVVCLLVLLLPLTARAQQPVGGEFRVNTFIVGAQNAARVARHPDGSFIVVWHSANQDGSQFGAFAQIYDGNGATVGGEFRVNSYTTGDQVFPSVAAAANGEFVVAWTSVGQDSQGGVFAQRLAPTGSRLGAEFRVNTYTTGPQGSPRVAASSGGSFVVVWVSVGQDGSLHGIFGQCFAAAGTPVGSEFRVNSYTDQYQYLPDVAMSASGSFAVVWMDHPRRHSYGQRYAADCTPSGGEVQAHSGLTPNIAMDAAGNFVVAAIRLTSGDGYGIWAQRFNSAGAAQGTEFRVNTYTPGFQEWPAVAMEPGGDFVVTWDTYSTTAGVVEEVSARAYRANGTPAGPEFFVNTYTTGPQSRPAVGMGDNGDFVIAWTSSSDGFGTGVNAQRFALPDLIFADGFNAGP